MTNIVATPQLANSTKLTIFDEVGNELGSIYLIVIESGPGRHYGLLSDLFIHPESRGHGSELLHAGIDLAQKEGCYKLICTSRYSNELAHHLYTKAGFTDWGKEFRLNLA